VRHSRAVTPQVMRANVRRVVEIETAANGMQHTAAQRTAGTQHRDRDSRGKHGPGDPDSRREQACDAHER